MPCCWFFVCLFSLHTTHTPHTRWCGRCGRGRRQRAVNGNGNGMRGDFVKSIRRRAVDIQYNKIFVFFALFLTKFYRNDRTTTTTRQMQTFYAFLPFVLPDDYWFSFQLLLFFCTIRLVFILIIEYYTCPNLVRFERVLDLSRSFILSMILWLAFAFCLEISDRGEIQREREGKIKLWILLIEKKMNFWCEILCRFNSQNVLVFAVAVVSNQNCVYALIFSKMWKDISSDEITRDRLAQNK